MAAPVSFSRWLAATVIRIRLTVPRFGSTSADGAPAEWQVRQLEDTRIDPRHLLKPDDHGIVFVRRSPFKELPRTIFTVVCDAQDRITITHDLAHREGRHVLRIVKWPVVTHGS
jgi:hypothetical protein